MTTYYWESETGHGQFMAENDESAKRLVEKIRGLLVLYRESDTVSGLPLVLIWEDANG